MNVALHHPPFKNAITPGAIVSARLGLADQAVKNLSNSIRRIQHFPQGLFYNIDHWYKLSLYADSVKNPSLTTQRDYIYDSRVKYNNPGAGSSGLPAAPFVQCGMEPLSIFATTLNEMLLQSHEGKIRVFPAVPDNWPVAFNLRARGAFMVAAERDENGEIPGVSIKSLQGGECRVQNPWPGQQITVKEITRGNRKTTHRVNEDDVLVFGTSKGSNYLLTTAGSKEKPLSRKTVYSGSPNTGPKQFKEAMLGKERNF
jgi:alpha-L-fucosidase 2